MYPSVRDDILTMAFVSLKQGLDTLGFDAVELNFDRDNSVQAIHPEGGIVRFKLDTPSALDEFRRHLVSNGIRVSALLMANNFGSEDLDGEIGWVTAAIKAASALGIPVVRIDAIMHGERDIPLEKNVRVFADAMLEVLDATQDCDVDMGIENHGFQGNNPDFLDLVLGKVGSPRLGVTIDTGNFYWRGHPLSRVYQIIEHLAPHCKHTHAKNIAYPPEKREIEREIGWEYLAYVSPLPDGDVDHRRVVGILRSAGYDRDLCLEDESLGRWTPEERIAVLRRDADFFREIL